MNHTTAHTLLYLLFTCSFIMESLQSAVMQTAGSESCYGEATQQSEQLRNARPAAASLPTLAPDKSNTSPVQSLV